MRSVIVLCGVVGLFLRLHEMQWLENQVSLLVSYCESAVLEVELINQLLQASSVISALCSLT